MGLHHYSNLPSDIPKSIIAKEFNTAWHDTKCKAMGIFSQQSDIVHAGVNEMETAVKEISYLMANQGLDIDHMNCYLKICWRCIYNFNTSIWSYYTSIGIVVGIENKL